MTGPDYPRPRPGSNALGEMALGVDPAGTFSGGTGNLGTMPPFDIWTTIISQWANSQILTTMIENFADNIDQTKNLDAFFDLVWNVDTAVGYGLDVWGRIVGITRTLEILDTMYFGFAEGNSNRDYGTFGQAPFYSGQPLTNSYVLSDHAYRQLILAKAFANICSNTIPAINSMLLTLFPGRGNCYVTEGPTLSDWFGFAESINASGFNQAPFYSGSGITRMTMTYTFEFVPTPVELAIVTQSNVLPKPTGVKASVVITPR